jgi:hypothetical protein
MKLDAVATVLWAVFQCEKIAEVTGHRPVATALSK